MTHFAQLDQLQAELQAALDASYEKWKANQDSPRRRYLEALAGYINAVWYEDEHPTGHPAAAPFAGIRRHWPHPAYHFGATELLLDAFLPRLRAAGVLLDSHVPLFDNYSVSLEVEESGAEPEEEARRFYFPAAWQGSRLLITLDFYHRHDRFGFTRAPGVRVQAEPEEA